jgi:hypothetical protein
VKAALDELLSTAARFRIRIARVSVNALRDPVGDADERAAMALLTTGAVERFTR